MDVKEQYACTKVMPLNEDNLTPESAKGNEGHPDKPAF